MIARIKYRKKHHQIQFQDAEKFYLYTEEAKDLTKTQQLERLRAGIYGPVTFTDADNPPPKEDDVKTPEGKQVEVASLRDFKMFTHEGQRYEKVKSSPLLVRRVRGGFRTMNPTTLVTPDPTTSEWMESGDFDKWVNHPQNATNPLAIIAKMYAGYLDTVNETGLEYVANQALRYQQGRTTIEEATLTAIEAINQNSFLS